MIMRVLYLFLFALSGCASQPDKTDSLPTLPVLKQLPTVSNTNNPDGLFTLSQEQEKTFFDYFNDETRLSIPEHVRLANYMERHLHKFTYRGETLKANAGLNTLQGNCMTLAIITTAYANLVDVPISYRKVNVSPVYNRLNGVLSYSSHVKSRLYNKGDTQQKAKARFIEIDYFRQRDNVNGEYVSREDFISRYYQNLASDHLMLGNLEAARESIRQALAIAPDNVSNINILAVIYKKLGYSDAALALFDYAYTYLRPDLLLFDNYANLLLATHQYEKAEEVNGQINSVVDDNPYLWIDKGRSLLKQGYSDRAKFAYLQSIEAAPYLHDAYLGLTNVHLYNGNLQLAKQTMAKALQLASYTPVEADYQEKLVALKRYDGKTLK